VFTFIASIVFFREKSTLLEVAGILLVIIGIILILFLR
jgi:multidrug transporter EmrE-like cation transporter